MQSSAGLSFAEKHLLKLGWTKGKGLGKLEQGMPNAVDVSDKGSSISGSNNKCGIGANSSLYDDKDGQNEWSNQWWDHLYNRSAQSIKNSAGSENSSSDSDDSSEEEILLDSRPMNRDRVVTTNEDTSVNVNTLANEPFPTVSEGISTVRNSRINTTRAIAAKLLRLERQQQIECAKGAKKIGPNPAQRAKESQKKKSKYRSIDEKSTNNSVTMKEIESEHNNAAHAERQIGPKGQIYDETTSKKRKRKHKKKHKPDKLSK